MCRKRTLLTWIFASNFFCTLLSAQATDEVGLRHFAVPLIDNEIHSRLFLQTLLEVGGSDVKLPENFPNQKIKVNRIGTRVALFTWNTMLEDFGVDLSLQNDALLMTVDLKTLEAKLNDFEETLVTFFGVEREAHLRHLSAADCKGPVVVFLHGLDSSKRLFGGTCDFLVANGYDLYFFEYPNDDRVQRNAARLSDALKSLPENRRQDISIITISMGGVITQAMLENPELTVEGVKRFIAVVPPFQGSEMAALRGFVEVGDHTLSIFFEPQKALDFWGDGMGRAGIDLQPGSLLMEQLDQLKRKPGVAYSIIAGNKGVFDPAILQKAHDDLQAEPAANGVLEAARRLTLDRMDLMLKFQSPHGDGAVSLESATLDGVEDRIVLPYSHLEFLTGFRANEAIPVLKEVLKRLPAVPSAPSP